MEDSKNIKIKPLFFLLGILLVIIIGSTIAYFYNSKTISNRFNTMTYDVELEEEFYDDWGTKKVTIKNKEESTDVVLRISYNEQWSKEVDGSLNTLSNIINGESVVNKNWTNTFTNDFLLGDDGWYYYKKTLSPGESINILDSISLNENLISNSEYYDDYKNYDYSLTFNYEAIQATSKAIKEIWNIDVTINDSSLDWR